MSESKMSSFELIHRPALGAVEALAARGIRLMPLPEGVILLVVGDGDPVILGNAAAKAGLSLRANGPDQSYLVGDVPMPRTGIRALADSIGEAFTVIDQSHGRIRIAVEGSVVEETLAKGTGVDLAGFEIGHATNTLVGHIPVHITRLSDTRFELMPLRGFAESLWRDLENMAAENSDHSL